MIDLKVVNAVLGQLEEERGIPREKIIEAIELALATAYKKEYGKKGQIVRAIFDINTGEADFSQIKVIVDENSVNMDQDLVENAETSAHKEEFPTDEEKKPIYNTEHHIMLADAQRIKKDAVVDEELVFPLTPRDDFGRIASQTAKQVIIQKIREAEKTSVMKEFGAKEAGIVTGTVQRIERGSIFLDLGRATGVLPYDEQIPGEKYRQGERLRAYLYRVDEGARGVFLRLSRSHPEFIKKLFELEAPELANGTIEIKAVAREAGSRSKIAVESHDDHIDPVGALVGQRGVRVSTVMSELGGERVDIIEWSEDPIEFISDALSPAEVISAKITDEDTRQASVLVEAEQQSLAIGKGGQNVRLAAKLTGWKIDIQPVGGEETEADKEKEASEPDVIAPDEKEATTPEEETPKIEDTTTTDEDSANADETLASEETTPEEKSAE